MRKLVYVLIIAIVMVFGLTFVYNNHDLVKVDYYGDQAWGFSWEGRIALLIVGTFVSGLVIGYLFSLLSNLRLRGKLMSSNRKLKKVESNVA